MEHINFKLIEPKILPLVKSLNNTRLVETFSSCEGHFDKIEEREELFNNKRKADVRFSILEGVSLSKVEHFINYLVSKFVEKYHAAPVLISIYKQYPPNLFFKETHEIGSFFVITLEPFDKKNSNKQIRSDIDNAIIQAKDLIDNYKLLFLD